MLRMLMAVVTFVGFLAFGLLDLFIFFFQAEDGIRDKLVTGFRRVLFRSVRHSGPRNGPTQRSGHVILDQEIGKALGTVLAGESDHSLNLTTVRSAECGVR